MNWLEPPFNMLITGITNCGKSEYVISELLYKQYRNKFDYIIIFCPTYHENQTYEKKYIYDDNDIIILIVDDNLDELLILATETYKNSGQVLFLIDDCANLYDSKHKSSQLTKLSFSARHMNISVWFITQKYNAVVKDYRDNIRMLIMYYNKDDESLKDAFLENNIIDKEDRNEIIKKLKENKYSKIVLRLEHPYEIKFIM